MSTTVIRKHISYLVRRGISKLPIPLRGERSTQRKISQANHSGSAQTGIRTAQADFDPPGAERRCSRRTAEPYSVGHSGCVIKQKHLNGFLSLKSFKNKGEKNEHNHYCYPARSCCCTLSGPDRRPGNPRHHLRSLGRMEAPATHAAHLTARS